MSCGGDSIIPLEMLRYSAPFTVAMTILMVACNRSPADTAKPVASASVSVSPAVVASGMPVELDVKFAVCLLYTSDAADKA